MFQLVFEILPEVCGRLSDCMCYFQCRGAKVRVLVDEHFNNVPELVVCMQRALAPFGVLEVE